MSDRIVLAHMNAIAAEETEQPVELRTVTRLMGLLVAEAGKLPVGNGFNTSHNRSCVCRASRR